MSTLRTFSSCSIAGSAVGRSFILEGNLLLIGSIFLLREGKEEE